MHPISTKKAPAALGAYNQAVKCGNTVYLAGQIPLDPTTSALCSTDISLQIEQVICNLSAVCKAAGGSLAEIVKLSVYLTDLGHFSLINEAMERHFSKPYPSRAVVGVLALPKGAQVEMDGIMIIP